MVGPCVFGALRQSLADRVLSGAWQASGDKNGRLAEERKPLLLLSCSPLSADNPFFFGQLVDLCHDGGRVDHAAAAEHRHGPVRVERRRRDERLARRTCLRANRHPGGNAEPAAIVRSRASCSTRRCPAITTFNRRRHPCAPAPASRQQEGRLKSGPCAPFAECSAQTNSKTLNSKTFSLCCGNCGFVRYPHERNIFL
jgi:hypothetical protein